MTFEKFVEEAMNSNAYINPEYGKKIDRCTRKVENPGDWAVSVEWVTGSVSGGSCWDEGSVDNHYTVPGKPEPEFENFDQLIIHFIPNITYLQYKALYSATVKEKEYTEYEYYGNSTNYREKYAYLRDIYDWLRDIYDWLKENGNFN